MAYCRYCGQELVKGVCDCPKARYERTKPKYQDNYETIESPPRRSRNVSQTDASRIIRDGAQSVGGILRDSQTKIENRIRTDRESSAVSEPEPKQPMIASERLNFGSLRSLFHSFCVRYGISEKTSSSKDPYERNVLIVPDCIEAEEDETVIRQYDVAKLRTRLKFEHAEGRLMVTNKRLLMRAAGTSIRGNVLQQYQFTLDEIGGIQMHTDYKFSLISLLLAQIVAAIGGALGMIPMASANHRSLGWLAFLMFAIAVGAQFLLYKRFRLKLFLLSIASGVCGVCGTYVLEFFTGILCAFNILICMFVPNLVLRVTTKGGNDVIIWGSQKALFSRQKGDDNSGFSEVMPWRDTVQAMNEIGTMIEDLKRNGDYAIQHWT